jgi:hypothetical protein
MAERREGDKGTEGIKEWREIKNYFNKERKERRGEKLQQGYIIQEKGGRKIKI